MTRSITIFALAIIAAVAGVFFFAPIDHKSNDTNVPAVKVSMPVDLSGNWQSVESRAGTKFVAEIKDNRVFVQMYAADGYTGLWYGTFDILQPGNNLMVSKAIEDDDHFVLSIAETKDFLYQNGSLIFNFSVMGTTTAIEMKRV